MAIENFVDTIPIVTKLYISAALSMTLAIYLFNIDPHMLIYHPRLVFSYGQYWRLITTFLYFGPFSLDLFFHGFFFIKYFKTLESGPFYNRTADFVYLMVFGATMLLILGTFTNVHLLSTALMFMYAYVWSKYNSTMRMSFFGLIEFNASMLPWMLLSFQYVTTGHFPVGDMLGIIVGHTYYYFNDVFPITHKFKPLQTPKWFSNFSLYPKYYSSGKTRRRYLGTMKSS